MTALTAAVEHAFAHRVHIRYLEVDQQGVVFNMWYLAFVDDALDAYLHHRGFPLSRFSELGFDLSLAHAELDWASGLHRGDEVDVVMSMARLGGKSLALDFAFRRGGEFTCSGGLVYAAVSSSGSGPVRVPDPLREALGEPAPLRER